MKKLVFGLSFILLVGAGCNLNKQKDRADSGNNKQAPVATSSSVPSASSTIDAKPSKVTIPQGKFELKVYDKKLDKWVNTNLTEKNILDAEAKIFNAPTGVKSTTIQVSLDSEGVSKFFNITSENVYQQVQIFLDGVLLSTPTVQEGVSNGTFVFMVDASLDQAQTWANKMRGYYYENPKDK